MVEQRELKDIHPSLIPGPCGGAVTGSRGGTGPGRAKHEQLREGQRGAPRAARGTKGQRGQREAPGRAREGQHGRGGREGQQVLSA
jgi:hypothetical protein